jgi:capsular polysaccharide transport system ATP-binding protein
MPMIRLDQVSKTYRVRDGTKTILDRVDLLIERGMSLGICGQNGAGKSTLLRLIAAVEQPSSGTVTRSMSVSWPIGYASAFQSSLSGADNVRFIARIYGRNIPDMLAFVDDFAELGSYLGMPIRTYSAGMLARLAFATSLAVDFDCYLIDEVIAAGDERFRERCQVALMERRERGTLILVSHDPGILRSYCTSFACVAGTGLSRHDTIEGAWDHLHNQSQMA